ncbi:uncharacterized protein LOC117112723 [Anneissia japonica]|uniref:uncharacterized protein LOC117112723 n=1 Tax=Anneissia japonica TaxID=1529436 RepID=UPI00142598E7|nr:uncharacterized protein LOC117112723 [Anneissia japonica]
MQSVAFLMASSVVSVHTVSLEMERTVKSIHVFPIHVTIPAVVSRTMTRMLIHCTFANAPEDSRESIVKSKLATVPLTEILIIQRLMVSVTTTKAMVPSSCHNLRKTPHIYFRLFKKMKN